MVEVGGMCKFKWQCREADLQMTVIVVCVHVVLEKYKLTENAIQINHDICIKTSVILS